MKVIQSTYPKSPNCPHAEIGDAVNWELTRGAFSLVRETDDKTVFRSAPVDRDGRLRSNGKRTVLIGVIAQVKSKNWILEIG